MLRKNIALSSTMARIKNAKSNVPQLQIKILRWLANNSVYEDCDSHSDHTGKSVAL